MKHWLRFMPVICIPISIVIGGCLDEGVYKIPISENEQFTEVTAIRVSREALKSAGKDVTLMEPVSYRNEPGQGENLLARNTLNRDEGYMLWHVKGEKKLAQYSVSMKKTNGYVICDVGQTK